MNNEARCLAWQQMRRQRHCPSLRVLRQGGPQAERHLAACPHCRAALEHAAEAAGLGRMLLELPLRQPPASDPVPGDIRALRPGIDPAARVDEDGIYYNPPLLLILSQPDDNDCVRVAQVFDEPGLQVEGDISLGCGLIAEAWNTYDVPCFALHAAPCVHVGRQYVEAVLAAAKEPFPVIDEFSPLFSFRSDECRTGGFFSLPLNQENLRRREAAAAESVRPSRVVLFFPTAKNRLDTKEAEGDDMANCLRTLLENPCPGGSLAFAAADSPSADPRPSQRMAVTLSRPDKDNGAPHVCAAELRVQPLPGKTLYSIDCRLPSPLPVLSFALRCGGVDPLETEASWLEKELLRIDAIFDGENCTPDDLRVAIVLSAEAQT